MELALDASVANALKSTAQKTRVITESWAESNMYCIACDSDVLNLAKPGTPVLDLICPKCQITYQLKARRGRHGKVVLGGAYRSTIDAIRENRAPNYLFLEYDHASWRVTGLFAVPSQFITETIVERRPPLPATARRAGWVGSKIHLSRLPSEAHIRIVTAGTAVKRNSTRDDWQKIRFLKQDSRATGGWGAEVFSLIRELQRDTEKDEFNLQTFYAWSTERLILAHPENHNVEAKIRQQLQVLRDGGVIEFLSRGHYRIIG